MLHACAHNPTGVDPRPEQWKELSALIKVRVSVVEISFFVSLFHIGIICNSKNNNVSFEFFK